MAYLPIQFKLFKVITGNVIIWLKLSVLSSPNHIAEICQNLVNDIIFIDLEIIIEITLATPTNKAQLLIILQLLLKF